MGKRFLLCVLASVVIAAMFTVGPAIWAASEHINYVDINKIKAEGLQRSQVMEICNWLTDVYGPRLTGSPTAQKGAEWVVGKLEEWGLVNVKIEPWPNRNGFDRGWINEKFHLAAVSPEKFPIPGTPPAWTPGIAGLVGGEVVLVTATTEEDLATYKGKLKNKWVMTQAALDVAAYWSAPSKCYTTGGIGGHGTASAAPPGVRRDASRRGTPGPAAVAAVNSSPGPASESISDPAPSPR